jgi:glycosyltransferase involved in cell wall biosynthesis
MSEVGLAEKPRLLLILTEFPPRIGGMQTHAIYLARHLHEQGYPLEVVTYQPVKPFEFENVDRVDRELPFPVRRVMSRLGYFHNFDVLRQIAARFSPDLVYCSTVFWGNLGEQLGVPVVSRSVGNDVMRPWIAYPFKPLSKLVSHPWIEDPLHRFFRRFEYPEIIETIWRNRRHSLMQESARKLDHVMANSVFTANLLENIGLDPKRVEVLVGGVDSKRFSRDPKMEISREDLGIPNDRFLMMTACRMVKKKGVDFLIERMSDIVARVPDAHLLLVGSGRHFKRFRRAAERCDVAEHITFAGKVPHDQIHALYKLADVFVLASRVQVDPISGQRDAETMGRVLCEANAASIPVLAARSGGIPSVIEHEENGLLFTPDDVDSLISVIERAREEPELIESMKRRGARIAKDKFDWSVIVRAHERCFQQILEARENGTDVKDYVESEANTSGLEYRVS